MISEARIKEIQSTSDRTDPFDRSVHEDHIAYLLQAIDQMRLKHMQEISNLRTMIEALKSTNKKMGA